MYSKFKEKLAQHIVLAAVLVGTLLLLGSWSFFVQPALMRAEKQNEQYALLEARLNLLQEFAQRQDYATYEQGLRQQLKKAEAHFVSKDNFNDVVAHVRQEAEKRGLKVVSLRLPEKQGQKSERGDVSGNI